LLIDDYGHWEGCRRAVDEYFAQPGCAPVLLNRVDYTARLAIRL
jgi:O-methyltransferase